MDRIVLLANEGLHECDSCPWAGPAAELAPIADLHRRVDPGGIVPSGECPKCGALAYPLERQRWLFTMTGGIQPGDVMGPFETDAQREQLLLQQLRDTDELYNIDGDAAIYELTTHMRRPPQLTSFSSEYMDTLRQRISAERDN